VIAPACVGKGPLEPLKENPEMAEISHFSRNAQKEGGTTRLSTNWARPSDSVRRLP
jgi:hypothetical protein